MNLPTKRPPRSRRLLFKRLRERGLDNTTSKRLRDWTHRHINQYLKAKNQKPLRGNWMPIYPGKKK